MRRLLLCVPMMILLLAGCGPAKTSAGEELALIIRGEYLEETPWRATAAITADYGQRVYQYELEAAWDGEETTLTLTAPETVAGMTARLPGGESLLEYDGMVLETGPLNKDGLTPVSAIPALLEAARSGYITAISLDEEEGTLRMDCGDPEGEPGTGTETSLWFDADSHALVRGEISLDGFRVILCEFSEFTKESRDTHGGEETVENLGGG